MDDRFEVIARRELGERPASVTRLDDGFRHDTFALACPSGEYVLQLSRDSDDSADALERGLGCYVALRESTVPVPPVVTETVQEYDGRRYTLVERLPGESAELAVSPSKTRTAARCLAEIHDTWRFDAAGWLQFPDGSPSVSAFEAGSVRARVRRETEEHARVVRDAGLVSAADALGAFLDDGGADVPAATQPVLCHNDYSPDNVLFRDGDVTGVLDFDRAQAGDRHRDVASSATAFWLHDPGADWDPRDAFYDGYRDAAALGPDFDADEPQYRVESLAGAVAGLAKHRGLSEGERTFYDQRLVEAVDRATRSTR